MLLLLLIVTILICQSTEGIPNLQLLYGCELEASGRFPEECDFSPILHVPAHSHKAVSLMKVDETKHRHT